MVLNEEQLDNCKWCIIKTEKMWNYKKKIMFYYKIITIKVHVIYKVKYGTSQFPISLIQSLHMGAPSSLISNQVILP